MTILILNDWDLCQRSAIVPMWENHRRLWNDCHSDHISLSSWSIAIAQVSFSPDTNETDQLRRVSDSLGAWVACLLDLFAFWAAGRPADACFQSII